MKKIALRILLASTLMLSVTSTAHADPASESHKRIERYALCMHHGHGQCCDHLTHGDAALLKECAFKDHKKWYEKSIIATILERVL